MSINVLNIIPIHTGCHSLPHDYHPNPLNNTTEVNGMSPTESRTTLSKLRKMIESLQKEEMI